MKLNPYLEVILAAIIWGSSGVFIKLLNLPITTITFFRVAIPTIILFIFLKIKKKKLFRGNNKLMLIASSLNTLRMFLYFVGFTYATISNAVVLWYTKPFFIVLLSSLILKEKISKMNLFYLFLSFLGVLFLFIDKTISFNNKDFIGMMAMLLSAIIVSFSMIIYKNESKRYSKMEMIFYQNVVGSFFFLPFFLINKPFPNIGEFLIGSLYAIIIGIIGFGLFFSAIKRINLSTATILTYLEVVSGILFGVLIFNDPITWNLLLGGGLIVLSAILLKK